MGIRDALAERTAAIGTLTHALLRLEMGSDRDGDDALDDLDIVDDLDKCNCKIRQKMFFQEDARCVSFL